MISFRFLCKTEHLIREFRNEAFPMTDTPPINPAIGNLFRHYRKQRINPSTGKAWTLNELSLAVSTLIQSLNEDGAEEGLSPSAISRLENASLLPGRAKLRVLANFLEIPEHELKPLIDLGESKTPLPQNSELRDQGLVRELEGKMQKSPLDWLKLIAAGNMAGLYYKSLNWAEDALLVIESPSIQPDLQMVLRALTQSKKAYAHFCIDDEELFLQRSLDWARKAELATSQLISASASDLAYLQIETVRSLTTASLELFNSRYLLHRDFSQEPKAEFSQFYSELLAIFSRFEKALQLAKLKVSDEEHQFLLELYLYYLREKDRLQFKYLEIMELQALWEQARQTFGLTPGASPIQPESIAALVYERLTQSSEEAQAFISGLYTVKQTQVIFSPAPSLQKNWQQLSQSMLRTLERHDQLESPNPNKAFQEAVMLYPITAARLGQFDRFVDLGYFKLIYMQTTVQTRPVWYYVRAYCYALAYQLNKKPEWLQTSLENWARYCFADKDTGACNLELFSHCLSEVTLWSTWFQLLHDTQLRKKVPLANWFCQNLQALMGQARFKRMRGKLD